MTDLKNKTVLVTGSSQGLGKKIAQEFSGKGANVIINYNSNRNKAEQLVQEINSRGGSAISVLADVSQKDQVEELVARSIQEFGKIDIVINNAGIMTTKLLKDFSEEEFDRHFAINVRSVFLVMKIVSERMENYGRIINISSSTTRMMMPTYSIYSATKAAVEQMTRVFAKEIGAKGITVNSVLPGPLITELFLEGKSRELIERIAGLAVLNRIGEVDDIIPLVLFLAGKESQWITGQNIGINGGMA
ncbi:SDR family oxidoreductase [Antarcticibacterium sp. 1MA-6-2]|uniref:SDR family oxidoreductase n=1 Tax=Antarcticibacterium sp. 1MA-6-2 TaxID=2908210 RepID=UPI001F1F3785|nr:SDR family oxidoreductase [Antarcticibacterium sp. 1MA-6-2]UJH92809.1 SDR family oxidoreductase [Antarcticibacterium sp. 1MA-6-2]